MQPQNVLRIYINAIVINNIFMIIILCKYVLYLIPEFNLKFKLSIIIKHTIKC